MTIVNSLPDRPLSRTEIDALGESDSIHGIFPVYGERQQHYDTAYATVLVVNGTGYALGYTGDQWKVAEERDVNANEGGVSFSDQETIEELQSAAVDASGVFDGPL